MFFQVFKCYFGLINCFSALPVAPQPIKVGKITKTTMEVIYNQLSQQNRVKQYRIQVLDTTTNANFIVSVVHINLGGSEYRKEIAGLKEGTSYKIRISATNSVGNGPWSAYVTVKTGGTPRKY